MRSCFNLTNGYVIMDDSFESTFFKQTFQKVFEKDDAGHLKMGFNASLEVFCYFPLIRLRCFLFVQVKIGNGLKINGVLGCCSSANQKTDAVSDKELGIGGTSRWKFGSINPRNTLAVLFEVTANVSFKIYDLA